MRRLAQFLRKLSAESPLRLFTRACVKYLPVSVRLKELWETVPRPFYLCGVLAAADQAAREGVPRICALELGVAGGEGLLELERYSLLVERETGVRIDVFGIDGGEGLPSPVDHRDHPDQWMRGDYPMDEAALRARLSSRTRLIVGDVARECGEWLERADLPPLGFVAVDLDLYSSTKPALTLLNSPRRNTLRRTIVYFDDVCFFFNHARAGELLAIDEFNEEQEKVFIDRWRGLRRGRPFPSRVWHDQMYIAHDLEGISSVRLDRAPDRLDLGAPI